MQLDQIVPWGRSLDEYRRIFRLSEADCAGSVLGCGDGPASFNTEFTALGGRVISCDPVYAFTAAQIEARVRETHETIVSQCKLHKERYRWTDFADADHLGRYRLEAMSRFLADFERGKAEGRYINAALPSLPFADNTFDLAVCSHLLFLYSDHLSLEFHLDSIRDACRVAREVRIFPLLTLECVESPYVAQIEAALAGTELGVERWHVDYEFQVGGNELLRVYQR